MMYKHVQYIKSHLHDHFVWFADAILEDYVPQPHDVIRPWCLEQAHNAIEWAKNSGIVIEFLPLAALRPSEGDALDISIDLGHIDLGHIDLGQFYYFECFRFTSISDAILFTLLEE